MPVKDHGSEDWQSRSAPAQFRLGEKRDRERRPNLGGIKIQV
nr:MAG TPA: hypothetical protein [Caudoviricetes sp.]